MLDKKIIIEYIKNNFYGDLNNMLIDYKIKYKSIAYFTSRLIYSLNE